jgi:antitoxin component YwqK of YwqJK toxin-antitoxin module
MAAMAQRIDVQADEVGWDDSHRLIVAGVPFTGEAVTYNWLDEMTSLITYEEGIREGVQRTWFDGGQLKSELTVHRGQVVGATLEWDQDGNLVRGGEESAGEERGCLDEARDSTVEG